MAEYILKDSRGKEQTFSDDKIFVQSTDGELVQFTMGTGGSASADLHYVTFMSYDGLTEYGKKAVADGDDCADPIARGIFDTPIRESDAQYDYIFGGWATEANGEADADWNKAITEDKTVYASFASAVRYYMITYYDEDGATVLKTENLAYGATPSYTPTKDGYVFTGWNPSFVTVTADASYVAQWEESVEFANASWEKIAEKSADGTASQAWAVGDTKTVILTLDDGTTEELTLVIAGFNLDTLSDGSGKAGISIICKTAPSLTSAWEANSANLYNNSTVHKYLENTVINMLPAELSAVIKSVVKKIDADSSSGTTGTKTVNANLWLLSMTEIGENSSSIVTLGNKYPLFTSQILTNMSDHTLPISGIGSAGAWTRTLRRVGGYNPYFVKKYINGYYCSSAGSTGEKQVLFGFCI